MKINISPVVRVGSCLLALTLNITANPEVQANPAAPQPPSAPSVAAVPDRTPATGEVIAVASKNVTGNENQNKRSRMTTNSTLAGVTGHTAPAAPATPTLSRPAPPTGLRVVAVN